MPLKNVKNSLSPSFPSKVVLPDSFTIGVANFSIFKGIPKIA